VDIFSNSEKTTRKQPATLTGNFFNTHFPVMHKFSSFFLGLSLETAFGDCLWTDFGLSLALRFAVSLGLSLLRQFGAKDAQKYAENCAQNNAKTSREKSSAKLETV